MERVSIDGSCTRTSSGNRFKDHRDRQIVVADATPDVRQEEAVLPDDSRATAHSGCQPERDLGEARTRPHAATPDTGLAPTGRSPRQALAVIALGSNLGNRATTLDRALEVLDRLPDIGVADRSPILETVAVMPNGPDLTRPRYLNRVAILKTRLEVADLLATLHAIEHAFGRERSGYWGDRTLDLDLVTYDDLVLSTPALTVPHPRAHLREFVLRPWLAMDPFAVVPGRGRVADLLAGLGSGDRVATPG